MSSISPRVLGLMSFVTVFSLFLVPLQTSAAMTVKPAAKAVKKATTIVKKTTVKKVAKIVDESATRCLTPEMKALHAKTTDRLKADVEKLGAGHDGAVKTYKEKIDMVWSAMEQPYCGVGSQGMVAVKHSYNKSVERIRAEFLAATKAKK